MRNTALVVCASIAALAIALALAASWRGQGREPVAGTPAAPGVSKPAAAEPRAIQPGGEAARNVAAPAPECAGLSGDLDTGTADADAKRQIEIDMSENAQIVGLLSQSDDPDHRLAALLMSRNHRFSGGERVGEVAGILRRDPGHTLAFWNLVLLCGEVLEHPDCADARLSTQAQRVDNENSEVWALLAVYRDRRGDDTGAVRAMQRALGSAVTSSYYAEQILLFERAYAAASDYGPSQRLVRAAGDNAALPLHHATVFNTCKRLAKKDILWRRMCFEYGGTLESRARSLIGESFGLAIQTEVAEMDGDHDKSLELRQRVERLRELVVDDDTGTIFDDRINARYLEELSVHGERAAMTFLRDEVERRRELAERCR